MFTVQIDSDQYAVKWQHAVPLVRPTTNGQKGCAGTLCELRRGKPGDKFAEMEKVEVSEAFLSDHDHYDPNVGRKVSLTRALTGFSKETRRQFWQAYHAMRGGKW